MAEVGLLVAFCSFTFFLGTVLLGAWSFTFERDHRALDELSGWSGRLIGLAMPLRRPLRAGALLHFRP